MKPFRFSLATTILALAFTVPALAGDMETTITSQPPTPPAAASAGDMYGGYVQSSEQTNKVSDVSSLTETALNLIQSVLSLF